VNYLDLFSGIGGFHKGLTDAGHEFDWVGFSEIDKRAISVYKKHYGEADELGDIKSIQLKGLPDKIELLTAGFPCQSFSIAGKRRGFNDTRGTLFFEIARILRYFKEYKQAIPYFILENVKGLLSHDNGRTFITIYGILTDLGYTVECQVLNTRWFLPQNRERIFIVGCLRELGRPQVFPIGEGNTEINGKEYEQCISGTISTKNQSRQCQFDGSTTLIQGVNNTSKGLEPRKDDVACTIKAGESGIKNLIQIGSSQDQKLSPLNGNSQTLNAGHFNVSKIICDSGQGRKKQVRDNIAPLRANTGAGHNNLIQNGVMIQRPHGFNKGGEKELPSLRGSAMEHNDFLKQDTLIRRLTTIECERLQGFPDDWTKYGKDGELISDTQRYKQLGNAVSVPVVKTVGEKLNRILI